MDVSRVLKPGAPFLFDLNMEVGYRERWKGSFSIVENDNVVIARSSYNPDAKTARLDLTLFRFSEGRWQRVDFPLSQNCYAADEVVRALQGAGFGDSVLYNLSGDRIAHEAGRTFFFTRKR